MIEKPYIQVGFNDDTVQWTISYLADDDDLLGMVSAMPQHPPLRAVIHSLVLAEGVRDRANVN